MANKTVTVIFKPQKHFMVVGSPEQQKVAVNIKKDYRCIRYQDQDPISFRFVAGEVKGKGDEWKQPPAMIAEEDLDDLIYRLDNCRKDLLKGKEDMACKKGKKKK